MSTIELKVYDILKKRFNDEEAALFINFINEKTTLEKDKLMSKDEAKNTLATKADLSDAKLDLIKWLIATGIAICGIIIAAIKLF